MNKEWMTSRERILKTINHEPVDRVPIDLGMHFSTSISAFAYWNLRKYLGLPVDTVEVCDASQFLPRVDEDILKRFHCDTMLLHPGWMNEQIWNPRGEYRFRYPEGVNLELLPDGTWRATSRYDGSGDKRMPAGGFFFSGQGYNLKDYERPEYEKELLRRAEHIYHETDYYTVYMSFDGYFSEKPDWLCDMLLEPEKLLARNESVLKSELARAGQLINLLGDHIQAVCISTDLGTQQSTFCSTDAYTQISAVYLKGFCDFIHRNSDYKVFMHSCGAIEPMIPILIDCGVDILNPVQISCANMKPENLKRKYGDKITFWGGGCNTQNVLGTGTTEQVRENVSYLMSVFKPGGGFVFNQVHNIMGNVPPENIVAMLDEAYANAFYEIRPRSVD